jgi:hypothetical protein
VKSLVKSLELCALAEICLFLSTFRGLHIREVFSGLIACPDNSESGLIQLLLFRAGAVPL